MRILWSVRLRFQHTVIQPRLLDLPCLENCARDIMVSEMGNTCFAANHLTWIGSLGIQLGGALRAMNLEHELMEQLQKKQMTCLLSTDM